MTSLLHSFQSIATTGARAVEPFLLEGTQYLAIAQLSRDVAGRPAHMNGGDSSQTQLPILRWEPTAACGAFVPFQSLHVPGGEDAEFFCIGERAFLATASLRTGSGPYVLDAESVVYECKNGRFEAFQSFPTFAAKQWRHFSIDGRHFLALALGVVMDGTAGSHPSQSCIFEWDGTHFALLQTIESGWGYNWKHAQVGGHHLLAYADHVAPSRLLRWTGQRFEDFQVLDGKSGRAFSFFESGGDTWLAFANMLGDSSVYRWDGSRFARHQTLCGPGARELLWLPEGCLVQANFMLGSREAPQAMAHSCVYRFEGGELRESETFASSAAVDVAAFAQGGRRYLVIANSLSPELRFATDSAVLEIHGDTA